MLENTKMMKMLELVTLVMYNREIELIKVLVRSESFNN